MDRREFINTAVAGAGLSLLPGAVLPGGQAQRCDKLHVAIIGHGRQGSVLFDAMRNIPGLHFQAVCDIWDYQRKGGMGRVRTLQRHTPNGYADIDEMLATEKGLDAAIIATPDFWHAPHALKCLEAGLHVYCEKAMSNTLDGARAIVRAMEKSGKLCQIGYQRRSNPRYRYTLEQLLHGHRIFGQIVNVNGQWNHSIAASREIAFKPKLGIKQDILSQYGYKDMQQFMNWRFYRDLCGGPIANLGSHQIDVFNWFLGVAPRSVCAFGGNDYFKQREHFDNVLAVFEYETPLGTVRASQQIVTTSPGIGGYYESFMGTGSTIHLSEQPAYTNIVGSGNIEAWDNLVRRGFLKEKVSPLRCRHDLENFISRPSRPPLDFELPGGLNKPPHQPHLENFFAAIRGEATLNCDARCAFASEAPMHWIDPSARNRQAITFTGEHLAG
jgi:predicted dehydrogenase